MVNGIAKGKRLSCLLLGLWLQESLYQVACHSYNSLFLLPQHPLCLCGSLNSIALRKDIRTIIEGNIYAIS